jgi:hypothetical protein
MMGKKYITFSIIFIIFCSCNGGVPSGILKPKEMEEVLLDMAIVDSYAENINTLNSTDKKTNWLSVEADKVLAIRKIEKEAFLNSYQFYKSRPDLLKVIVDTMHNKLQRNKDKIYNAAKFKFVD